MDLPNTPPGISAAPKVSVLLPAYNAARYLASAIESVLTQTERSFELIVVDDGSKDSTLSILQTIAARNPRVRVISRPNTGIVGALNDAFAASRGEFLARMDGDDYCMPHRFERQLQYLTGHPEVVMVGSNVMVMDEEGDDIAPLKGLKFTHEEIDAQLLACHWPLVHPTVMIRRSALEAVGGYRQGTFPHEDHDLFLRLAEVGQVAAISEILLRYRRHSGSVSWNSDSWSQMNAIVLEACDRRRIPPPPTSKKEEAHRVREKTNPEPEYVAKGRLYRTWAWHALGAGNVHTARKYAIRAVKTKPLTAENLKLLACVARGR